ncbi:15562_t:CDS:2 [Rhizophagus irregularis]|nr:15562_t:CDS:2 [Rhizophagus irregularis]
MCFSLNCLLLGEKSRNSISVIIAEGISSGTLGKKVEVNENKLEGFSTDDIKNDLGGECMESILT